MNLKFRTKVSWCGRHLWSFTLPGLRVPVYRGGSRDEDEHPMAKRNKIFDFSSFVTDTRGNSFSMYACEGGGGMMDAYISVQSVDIFHSNYGRSKKIGQFCSSISRC